MGAGQAWREGELRRPLKGKSPRYLSPSLNLKLDDNRTDAGLLRKIGSHYSNISDTIPILYIAYLVDQENESLFD